MQILNFSKRIRPTKWGGRSKVEAECCRRTAEVIDDRIGCTQEGGANLGNIAQN
jgi:hypothetical protein